MQGSIVLLTGVRVTVHTSGGHQQGATDPETGAEARLLRKAGSTTIPRPGRHRTWPGGNVGIQPEKGRARPQPFSFASEEA